MMSACPRGWPAKAGTVLIWAEAGVWPGGLIAHQQMIKELSAINNGIMVEKKLNNLIVPAPTTVISTTYYSLTYVKK